MKDENLSSLVLEQHPME